MTHKLCEAMSTMANIGLNQADYVTISRTESSSSTAGASTTRTTAEAGSSTKGQPMPTQNEITSSSERLAAVAAPNQDNITSLSSSEEGRKTMETIEQLANHKSESAKSESGQTRLITPHSHVTSEVAATKGVDVKGDGAMTSSSKGTPSGGSGGSEVQLPAKQALAVLSNVSKS